MDLLVHYSENVQLLSGLPREISKYQIKDGKPKHANWEKVAFILRVSNNIHQIPCLESADLQEEWTEEEKIPVKKDIVVPPPKTAEVPKTDNDATEKTAEDTEMKSEESKEVPLPKQEAPKQEFEIRKKAKKSTVALKVETQSHALPNEVRKDFTTKETSWFN